LRIDMGNPNKYARVKIFGKLQELGVGPYEIGDWLDMYRSTASPRSGDTFKKAALELADLEKNSGASYAGIIKAYDAKQQQLTQLDYDR